MKSKPKHRTRPKPKARIVVKKVPAKVKEFVEYHKAPPADVPAPPIPEELIVLAEAIEPGVEISFPWGEPEFAARPAPEPSLEALEKDKVKFTAPAKRSWWESFKASFS
jgi:hypothetical protein